MEYVKNFHPMDMLGSIFGQTITRFNGQPVRYYGQPSQSGTRGPATPPQMPSGTPSPFQWTFPQYSQTWAFTPPAPTPYMNPPAFDPKSSTGYAAAPKPTTTTKSAQTPFSLTDLMTKYK